MTAVDTAAAVPRQRTLNQSFTLSGVGIHTGKQCTVRVSPADAGFGRMFASGEIRFAAHVSSIVATDRSTTVGCEGARISTVEHLLAALAAHNIDNALIEVEGPEIPILDGSALPFSDAVAAAGSNEVNAAARVIRLDSPVRVEAGGSTAEALPAGSLSLTASTHFDYWPAGSATITARPTEPTIAWFHDRIAPARTFGFDFEVEALRARGMSQGASLDNALVIAPAGGFSSPLRVDVEWCAHKLLDLIGDLALLNARLSAEIITVRPGHALNAALARAIDVAGRTEDI